MPVQVVVLEAESTNLLGQWRVIGGVPRPSDRWGEVAMRLRADGQENQLPRRVEVLFCFSEVPFENYDHALISTQATGFRELSPSARLHAVHDLDIAPIDPIFGHDAIAQWTDTARRVGVDDLLELHCCLASDPSSFVRLVREACARSTKRTGVIEALQGRRWQAVIADRVPGTTPHSVGILDPFVRYGLTDGARSPLVIVVRAGEDREQRAQVERVLKEHEPSEVVVALLNGHASSDLKAVCQERQIDWLVFRGLFELRYFLLRMNEAAKPHAAIVDAESRRPRGDSYVSYEDACDRLGSRIRELGESSPEHLEFLSLEHRLRHAIDRMRRGVGGEPDFNHAVEQLNRLSVGQVGETFNALLWPSDDNR